MAQGTVLASAPEPPSPVLSSAAPDVAFGPPLRRLRRRFNGGGCDPVLLVSAEQGGCERGAFPLLRRRVTRRDMVASALGEDHLVATLAIGY